MQGNSSFGSESDDSESEDNESDEAASSDISDQDYTLEIVENPKFDFTKYRYNSLLKIKSLERAKSRACTSEKKRKLKNQKTALQYRLKIKIMLENQHVVYKKYLRYKLLCKKMQ